MTRSPPSLQILAGLVARKSIPPTVIFSQVPARILEFLGLKRDGRKSGFFKTAEGAIFGEDGQESWNISINSAMASSARSGNEISVRLGREWGATNFNEAMVEAAKHGHEEIVRLCRDWGATKFYWAMANAAMCGLKEIVWICSEGGATNFKWAMSLASTHGQKEIVRLCREWGAKYECDGLHKPRLDCCEC